MSSVKKVNANNIRTQTDSNMPRERTKGSKDRLEYIIPKDLVQKMSAFYKRVKHEPFRKKLSQNPDALAYSLGVKQENHASGYKLVARLYEDKRFMKKVKYQKPEVMQSYLIENYSELVQFVSKNNLVVNKDAVGSTKYVVKSTNVAVNTNVAKQHNVTRNENAFLHQNYHSYENANIVHKVVAAVHYAVAAVSG